MSKNSNNISVINFSGTLYKKDNAAFMQKMASFGPISKLDSIFGSPTLIFLFDAESCATVRNIT